MASTRKKLHSRGMDQGSKKEANHVQNMSAFTETKTKMSQDGGLFARLMKPKE